MRIFNLIGQEGTFETRFTGEDGTRSFGFWTMFESPVTGDLVVKPKSGEPSKLTVWKIRSVDSDPFTGSNGDTYWRGIMEDCVL